MKHAPLARRGRSPQGTAGQRGASLIELLVAVLILSLGLLGLAGMQARALRAQMSSEQRTQAVVLVQELLEVMRVDRASAMQGDYNTAGGADTPLCAVPSAAASFAQLALSDWLTQAKASLGGDQATTCAVVTCDALGVCSVQLAWDDSAAGGLSNQSIALTSRL